MKKYLFGFAIFFNLLIIANKALPQCNGLVGQWLFNGNLNDETSNANHGTGFGGITFTTGVDGTTNSALLFDGIDDYVNIPNHIVFQFGNGSFTLSYWYNTTSTEGDNLVNKCGSGNSAPAPYYGISTYAGDGNTSVRTSFNSSILDANGPSLANGQWHHIVFTRNGSLLSLYIDGVLNNSGSFPPDDISNSFLLVLGRNQEIYQYTYEGKMDNLRLYNRSLSGIEVTSLYSAEQNTIAGCGALPLSLLNFTGQIQNQNIVLHWQTENEINTSHFEIERSGNGATFEKINTVSAKNTAGRNEYSFTDNSTWNSDTRFYRLKMVDIDGRSKFSNIIKLSNKAGALLSIFPNPATDAITISGLTGKGEMRLYNIEGKELIKRIVTAHSELVNIGLLAKGIYLLKVTDADNVQQLKIVKQ